jgi:hypothetical protein
MSINTVLLSISHVYIPASSTLIRASKVLVTCAAGHLFQVDRNVGHQPQEGVQLHGHELNTTSDWLLISLLVFVNCLEYWQQTDTRLDTSVR